MSNEQNGRLYTTGEIALSMGIVALVLVVPVLAGVVYFFWWM
jgi:hypothetical protein